MEGGQGTKCFVTTLCLGSGGPKVLFGLYSHMKKVQNWVQGPMAPVAPLNLLLRLYLQSTHWLVGKCYISVNGIHMAIAGLVLGALALGYYQTQALVNHRTYPILIIIMTIKEKMWQFSKFKSSQMVDIKI